MTVRPPSQSDRHLFEDFRPLQFGALSSGQKRTDRDKGIIYGVKFVGKDSINPHGEPGAESTQYLPEALQEALPRYDGIPFNCNHPERDASGKPVRKDRPAEDRMGKTFSPQLRDGEIFGNLRLLKSHPMYERLMEAAENPELADCFALSHNAWGRGEVRKGVYKIARIPKVASMDLVADGGTNRSLFESHTRRTMKLSELLESKPDLKPRYAPLLKVFEAAGDMAVDGEKEDYRDHLHAAKKMCEDAGDFETADSIHKLMKPSDPAKEEKDEPKASGGEKDDKGEDGDKPKKSDDSDKKMEARFAEVGNLCESQRFDPSMGQLKLLMALPGVADRKALIKEFQAAGSPTRRGPQSRSLHTQPVPESADNGIPKDAEGLLQWLNN